MSRLTTIVVGAALALCGRAAAANRGSPISHQTGRTDPSIFNVRRIPLQGEGRGDFLTADLTGNRLYVTHGSRVHILGLSSLKEVAEVSGLTDAHGVAVDHASGHAFVTDSGPNAVVMFDSKTGNKLKTIPAGEKPDAILSDPLSGKVLAFNGEGSDVTVIDPATAQAVGRIKLPSNPESPQTDGAGRIWVTMGDADAIAEIDAKSMKFVRSMRLPGCNDPAPP